MTTWCMALPENWKSWSIATGMVPQPHFLGREQCQRPKFQSTGADIHVRFPAMQEKA